MANRVVGQRRRVLPQQSTFKSCWIIVRKDEYEIENWPALAQSLIIFWLTNSTYKSKCVYQVRKGSDDLRMKMRQEQGSEGWNGHHDGNNNWNEMQD